MSKMKSHTNSIPKHVIVYQEPGRFGGWPANHGIWNWGNEILVGFERAYYQANDKNHSIVWDKPAELGLARSLDGEKRGNWRSLARWHGLIKAPPQLWKTSILGILILP